MRTSATAFLRVAKAFFEERVGAIERGRGAKDPLFDAFDQIRSNVAFVQLAEFDWDAEAGTGFAENAANRMGTCAARERITFKQTPYALHL